MCHPTQHVDAQTVAFISRTAIKKLYDCRKLLKYVNGFKAFFPLTMTEVLSSLPHTLWEVSTINTNITIARAVGSLNHLHFCLWHQVGFCGKTAGKRVSRQERVLPSFQWNWTEAFRVSHNGRWWNEWKANGKITSKCLPSSVKWKRRQTSMEWCKGRGLLSSTQTLWPNVSEGFLWCCL